MRRLAAAHAAAGRALHALERAGSADDPAGNEFREHWRAHERHRSPKFSKLILAGNYEEALERRAAAGRKRRADHRHQHGRRHARFGEGDDDISESDRVGAGHRARADHDRQLQMDGDRGGFEMRPGQRRSSIRSASRKARRSSCEQARLVRRYGAAVVVMAFDEQGQADTLRAQDRDLPRAPIDILTEKVGFPPQDIIFDPNILTVATGIEEHNNYAVDFIEATRLDQGQPAAVQGQRRRQQYFVLVPRQQCRCARRCTRRFCTTRSRPGWTWASSMRAAGGLRRDSQGPAGTGRRCAAESAAGCHRAADQVRRTVKAEGQGGGRSKTRGGRARSRSGCRTRW